MFNNLIMSSHDYDNNYIRQCDLMDIMLQLERARKATYSRKEFEKIISESEKKKKNKRTK